MSPTQAQFFPNSAASRKQNQIPVSSDQVSVKRFSLVCPLALLMAAFVVSMGCAPATKEAALAVPPAKQWIPLFNGKNLDGWTPKITGYALGENFGNTFRVEDGVLKVAYDHYENFGNRFGHLFYQTPFSHYRLRVEYRFVGTQIPGGPGWALRNSGIMIHCQDPKTMRQEQDFPVSIEVQLLGGDGTNPRPTLNLCTPGTHVVINGKIEKTHCIDSKSETFHGDQWVSAELEVRVGGVIRHFVNGKLVLEYEQPQLDDTDSDAKKLIKAGNPLLTGGYISLQSESHPCEFRRVEILPLD
jgi:hypothetical protein